MEDNRVTQTVWFVNLMDIDNLRNIVTDTI